MQENKNKKINIGHRILIIIVFVFLIVLFGFRASGFIETKNMVEHGIIVKAKIVDILIDTRETQSNAGTGSWRYNLAYLYIDENGIEYSGGAPLNTYDEEYARAQIGKTVEIYVDGKGNSVAVYAMPESFTWDIAREVGICALSSVGFVAYIAFIIFYPKHKKRKLTSKQSSDNT